MSLLSLATDRRDLGGPFLTTPPSTAGQRFSAEFDAAMAPDRYFNIESSRRDFYTRANDQMHAAGLPVLPLPMDPASPDDIRKPGYNPALLRRDREQAFIDATRAAAEANPDQILAENIDRLIGEAGNRARQRAGELSGTGNGLAAFAGGVLAPTPENILGFFVPPAKAVLGAVPIASGFLRSVGREALFQAEVNAGLTGFAELLDVAARRDTGTTPGVGEIADNVLMSAAGGAVLGGGFHALHIAPRMLWERWNRLPESLRADAPLEVRDAMHAIGTDVLYGGRNRLGLPWELHERYQGNALDAVMRGRPVDLPEISPADRPLTALARIMQQPAEPIAPGALRSPFDTVNALPDADIEAFARQQKPRSFERIDRIDAELAELRKSVEELGRRTPSIADLVDMETGARLREIETDLSAPTLTKKERAALEREREMITATVDPKDRLPKAAQKALDKERVEISKKVAKLEEQRGEAKATADQAVLDLRTKLGRYAEDIEPKRVAEDLGFADTGSLAAALERADFDRLLRAHRDFVPEPATQNAKPASALTPSKAPQPATPEQAAALETRARATIEAGRDPAVEIDGREMPASKALEELDRRVKAAETARSITETCV